MANPLYRSLTKITPRGDIDLWGGILTPIIDKLSSQNFVSAGLAISAGGATTAKTANTITFVAGGVHQTAGAATLPALTGFNFGAGQYAIALLQVDNAGTFTWQYGAPGATAQQAKFPAPVAGKAVVGYILVTYASAFTGGTTPLDTATTVYVNVQGPFDPTAVL